jgi:AcrR family transcriptional regulator
MYNISEHVHLNGGRKQMRRKDETLHHTLLEFAREIVNEQGPDALNIRALAKRSNVASGTVYNYFESKDDILLAITEEYWRKALAELRNEIQADTFPEQLREIYAFLRNRLADSAGMLMSSLHNIESAGRDRMSSMQKVLMTAILHRMQQDKNISPDIWDETLSDERFADFIFMNMMMLLRMNASSIDPFIEIVKRTLYLKKENHNDTGTY